MSAVQAAQALLSACRQGWPERGGLPYCRCAAEHAMGGGTQAADACCAPEEVAVGGCLGASGVAMKKAPSQAAGRSGSVRKGIASRPCVSVGLTALLLTSSIGPKSELYLVWKHCRRPCMSPVPARRKTWLVKWPSFCMMTQCCLGHISRMPGKPLSSLTCEHSAQPVTHAGSSAPRWHGVLLAG